MLFSQKTLVEENQPFLDRATAEQSPIWGIFEFMLTSAENCGQRSCKIHSLIQ